MVGRYRWKGYPPREGTHVRDVPVIKTTLGRPTYAQNVLIHSRISALNRYAVLNMLALFQEEMIDVAIDVMSCFGIGFLPS